MKYLFLFAFLGGCASHGCIEPQIRDYTAEEQLKQADAESRLPYNSPLIDPLLEWASLRNQLRVSQ